jgi:hypothetical protein
MELILFALPAVKFDQGYPYVPATNAFFKKNGVSASMTRYGGLLRYS